MLNNIVLLTETFSDLMADFTEELATKPASVMIIALYLEFVGLMSPLEMNELSSIPQAEGYKRATQLVHTMYNIIERDSYNAHTIKTILIREAQMHLLVDRWHDNGKHLKKFLV